jgi:hypothetical protein
MQTGSSYFHIFYPEEILEKKAKFIQTNSKILKLKSGYTRTFKGIPHNLLKIISCKILVSRYEKQDDSNFINLRKFSPKIQ